MPVVDVEVADDQVERADERQVVDVTVPWRISLVQQLEVAAGLRAAAAASAPRSAASET